MPLHQAYMNFVMFKKFFNTWPVQGLIKYKN
jgi:hypothetical protein